MLLTVVPDATGLREFDSELSGVSVTEGVVLCVKRPVGVGTDEGE